MGAQCPQSRAWEIEGGTWHDEGRVGARDLKYGHETKNNPEGLGGPGIRGNLRLERKESVNRGGKHEYVRSFKAAKA